MEAALETRKDVFDDKLVVRFLKRYLVWREHVQAREEQEDEQLSCEQLARFFADRADGASLDEICGFFSGAKDVEMLVWRLQQVAVLTPMGLDKHGEVVESVYKLGAVTKKRPAEDETVEKQPPAKKSMLKCSGRTALGRGCKRRKLMDPGEAEYQCRQHN
ncbi:hypothetical protein CC86DRAFT_402652 [Ophiobolus disseminans]|uniref:Uncharacterized protein n=1 Tax=Ophiobolus disseminans TaxID=1469910 RepID=A0A6A7ADG5_9PLEO|nr:hypothetical protein CC86DRAFT_402652 [Ophiobolus disseminans]